MLFKFSLSLLIKYHQFIHCILTGIVLGTLFVGGQFMSRGDITAGDLMSFLVATQTVERFVLFLVIISFYLLC